MPPSPCDYEVLVQETYEAILREGDVAIDVGAHLGRHCIPMARRVFPAGRVHAIEPLPICHRALTNEIAELYRDLSGVLTIHGFALSDYSGCAPFVVASEALAYSGLQERTYPWQTRLRRIPVDVNRLDDLFLDLPSLRYIKIDAEGGEYHILKGGTACLRKFRPVVGFEFGGNAISRYGITPEDMARFWSDHGFTVFGIDGMRYAEQEFVRSTQVQRIWDYVAVPAEHVALHRIVVDTLTRPHSRERVARYLSLAHEHVPIGITVPPLRRFRRSYRWLARWCARVVLFLARIVTQPQRQFNAAMVEATYAFLDHVRDLEELSRKRDRKLAALEQTMAGLLERLNVLEDGQTGMSTCGRDERLSAGESVSS